MPCCGWEDSVPGQRTRSSQVQVGTELSTLASWNFRFLIFCKRKKSCQITAIMSFNFLVWKSLCLDSCPFFFFNFFFITLLMMKMKKKTRRKKTRPLVHQPCFVMYLTTWLLGDGITLSMPSRDHGCFAGGLEERHCKRNTGPSLCMGTLLELALGLFLVSPQPSQECGKG